MLLRPNCGRLKSLTATLRREISLTVETLRLFERCFDVRERKEEKNEGKNEPAQPSIP